MIVFNGSSHDLRCSRSRLIHEYCDRSLGEQLFRIRAKGLLGKLLPLQISNRAGV